MVQMSKQMKARHHTRRPPRRVSLWCYGVGFLEDSIHKLSEGPPGIPQFQHPSLVGAWEDLSWCFFHVLHFNKFVKAPLFYWCFCCWWYDMLMWWNSMFPHRSEKKKQSFYMMISLCLQQHHIPMFHDYIPIVFHCYPKLFPQPPTTPLLLDPELRPWQIWRACVAIVIIYTYHNLYQNLYQNLYHVCITCI